MIAKRDIFTFIGILGMCILWFCHSRVVYNEMDVVPFAMGQFNSEYLANDWYLHLDIPYRSWFSYPVGYIGNQLGIIPTVLVGRLVLYLLFSIGLTLIIRTLERHTDRLPFILSIIVFNALFNNGMGAAEWMIGGIETKSFAYAFVLFSLHKALRGQWMWSFFWAGLAFSFHLLVGMYHTITLSLLALYSIRTGKLNWRQVLYFSPIFLVSGYQGLLGVEAQLTQSVSLEAVQGWQSYVSTRVAHHVLPIHFSWTTWPKMLALLCILIAIFKRTRSAITKQLIVYGSSTIVFTLIGLIVYTFLGDHIIMRVYFFRFPDIMLPMTTLLVLASFLSELQFREQNVQKITKFIPYLIGIFLIIQMVIFTLDLRPSQKEWRVETSSDINLQKWVQKHTQDNDVIIVNPKNKYVYLNYNRPTFVTWKHAPQNGQDLYEWNRRLKMITGGQPIQSRSQLLQAYEDISKEQCQDIVEQYPSMKYIILDKNKVIELETLFVGEHEKICALP